MANAQQRATEAAVKAQSIAETARTNESAGQNNITNGVGVHKWTRNGGEEYAGEWKNGQQHGIGVHKYSDSSQYAGECNNGTKHGVGVYKWITGNEYAGEYKDGKLHGYGVYKRSDGKEYAGEWKDGACSGQGVKRFADGTIEHDGEWKEGKPVLPAMTSDLTATLTTGQLPSADVVQESSTAAAAKAQSIAEPIGTNGSTGQNTTTNGVAPVPTPIPTPTPAATTTAAPTPKRDVAFILPAFYGTGSATASTKGLLSLSSANHAFQHAVKAGNLDHVRTVHADVGKDIGRDIDVNFRDPNNGRSFLHWAAFYGHNDVANFLIELGANIDINGLGGCTPLHLAAQEGRVELVTLLLAKGADKDKANTGGATALCLAARQGYLSVVQVCQ